MLMTHTEDIPCFDVEYEIFFVSETWFFYMKKKNKWTYTILSHQLNESIFIVKKIIFSLFITFLKGFQR